MHQIYVFSSTGNTLHAAERVGEGLGGAHLINMALAQGKGTEAAGDSVGICYPVHAFGAPAVVHRFIEAFPWTPEAGSISSSPAAEGLWGRRPRGSAFWPRGA